MSRLTNVYVVCYMSYNEYSKEPQPVFEGLFSSMQEAEEFVKKEAEVNIVALETDPNRREDDDFYRIMTYSINV